MNSYFKNITFDKVINYLIIGLAFSLPITKAGIVFFQHAIILAFLFRGDFSSAFQELKQSKVIVVLFLFILLSMLSIIWSSDKTFALLYVKKYYHFLSVPIIYLYFNPKYIKHTFNAFLTAMLISQVFSYGIFFGIIDYNNVLPDDPSPFMNHSDYSMYLSFTAIILLSRMFFTHDKWRKLFYIMFFLTTTSNLFLTGGRTGQLIFVVSLFIIIFLNIKHKIKAAIIAVTLCAGIVILATNVSPFFKERATQAYNDISQTFINKDYSGSFGRRVSLWIIGTNVFSNNILMGTGIGDEANGMQRYIEKYKLSKEHTSTYTNNKGFIDYHSMYVQHAAQLGIFGLLVVTYLMYSLFIIKFRSRMYRNICIGFAISIFIYSIVGNLLHTIVPMSFFAFFVGLLSAISRYEQKISVD